MSQAKLPLDLSLMVRDGRGRYRQATPEQVFEAARRLVDLRLERGVTFTAPAVVRDYLRTKLAGFEHEVFAVLFLDTGPARVL